MHLHALYQNEYVLDAFISPKFKFSLPHTVFKTRETLVDFYFFYLMMVIARKYLSGPHNSFRLKGSVRIDPENLLINGSLLLV